MRILFAVDTYPPNVNGAAYATHRIIKELSKRGHEVSVVAPSTSFKSYEAMDGKVKEYRLRSILVQKAQQFRVSPNIFRLNDIKEVVEKVQPDVIHINNPGFIGQSAVRVGRQLHIPLVGTTHFMPENIVHYLRLPDFFEKMVNSLVWLEYARVFGKLDMITSPTPTAAKLTARLIHEKKVVVISNGLDLKEFNPHTNGDYLKERYHIPNKVTLLFVGRLDKEKNLDVFIRAIAHIKDKADFHAVIVGKGKEGSALQELAEKLSVSDRITFTGYLPDTDLPSMYKVGNIFVMPSIAELQSLVVMEAMATGEAIVGADAVALPHLIKNGRNGYLFKPEDDKDLAEKLLKIIKDDKLRAAMSANSLVMIKEHDMEHVVDLMEKVYQKAIKEFKSDEQKNKAGNLLTDNIERFRQINKYGRQYIKRRIRLLPSKLS